MVLKVTAALWIGGAALGLGAAQTYVGMKQAKANRRAQEKALADQRAANAKRLEMLKKQADEQNRLAAEAMAASQAAAEAQASAMREAARKAEQLQRQQVAQQNKMNEEMKAKADKQNRMKQGQQLMAVRQKVGEAQNRNSNLSGGDNSAFAQAGQSGVSAVYRTSGLFNALNTSNARIGQSQSALGALSSRSFANQNSARQTQFNYGVQRANIQSRFNAASTTSARNFNTSIAAHDMSTSANIKQNLFDASNRYGSTLAYLGGAAKIANSFSTYSGSFGDVGGGGSYTPSPTTGNAYGGPGYF